MRIVLLLLPAFLVLACLQRREKTEAVTGPGVVTAATNDLPAMPIKLTDSTTVEVKKLKGKTVLVLFQPDCDHCQHEAQQIRDNLKAFSAYTTYFISSSPMAQIKQFALDYELWQRPNVVFANTATENILNNFGPIEAPSLYIYSAEGKLVQQFNGQVDVGVILKYL